MQDLPCGRRARPSQNPAILRELSLLPASTLPAWLALPESDRASAFAQGAASERRSRTAHAVLGDRFQALPLGVVVVDRNYDVQAINDPAYTLLDIICIAGGRDFSISPVEYPTKPFRAAIDAAFHVPPSQGPVVTLPSSSHLGEPRTLEVACYPAPKEGTARHGSLAVWMQ